MSYSEYEQEGDPYKRKSFSWLVFPRLQIRLIGLVFASAIGPVLIAGWAFYYLIYRQFTRLLQVSQLTLDQKTEYLANLSFGFTYLLVICIAFAFLVTGLAVYLSRKVAGPIYNIGKVIELYLGGHSQAQVVLRKGDEFIILSDRVNALIKQCNQGGPKK